MWPATLNSWMVAPWERKVNADSWGVIMTVRWREKVEKAEKFGRGVKLVRMMMMQRLWIEVTGA